MHHFVVFKIFFASGGKGALIPLTKILPTVMLVFHNLSCFWFRAQRKIKLVSSRCSSARYDILAYHIVPY